MASTEAQLMQALTRLRSLEGTVALLLREREKARDLLSEAEAALEHVSYALIGDHYKAAMHVRFPIQNWLRDYDRVRLQENTA